MRQLHIMLCQLVPFRSHYKMSNANLYMLVILISPIPVDNKHVYNESKLKEDFFFSKTDSMSYYLPITNVTEFKYRYYY